MKTKRIIQTTATHMACLIVGTVLLFSVTVSLPDAAYQLTGPYANEMALNRVREEFGTDSDLVSRMSTFGRNLIQGELRGLYTREPLVPVLCRKAVTSVSIVGLALSLTVIIGSCLAYLMSLSDATRRITNAIIGLSATVPVFITATLLLVLSGPLGIPLQLCAALSLAIFPAVLVASNLDERWRELRKAPYNVFAWHYGVPGREIAKRTLANSPSTIALVFNSLVFFLTSGVVIVEPLFGLPGVGRWLLRSTVRLDMPAILLIGVSIASCVVLLSLARRLLEDYWREKCHI